MRRIGHFLANNPLLVYFLFVCLIIFSLWRESANQDEQVERVRLERVRSEQEASRARLELCFKQNDLRELLNKLIAFNVGRATAPPGSSAELQRAYEQAKQQQQQFLDYAIPLLQPIDCKNTASRG